MIVRDICNLLNCKKKIVEIYIEILQNGFSVQNKENKKMLEFLEKSQLIFSTLNSNGCLVFYPLDPKISWNAFLLKKIWENTDNLFDYDEKKFIPKSFKCINKKIKKIINFCQKIKIKDLEINDIIIAYDNKEQIIPNLCNFLQRAESSIKTIIYHPYLMGENVWLSLCEKMKYGIEYTRISHEAEMLYHGTKVIRNEINIGEKLFYSKQEINTLFYIVDDKELFIITPENKKMSAQWLKHKGIVDIYLKIFNETLNSSVEAQEILKVKDKEFYSFLKNNKFSKKENAILKIIYNYGLYTDKDLIKKYKPQILILKKKYLIELEKGFVLNWEGKNVKSI